MRFSSSECKLFSIVQTEQRGHLLSKVRTGANLMLRSLDAADAQQPCVAWLSLKAASSCREELGVFPVPVLDAFQPPALLSVPVSDRLLTHVPHMQGFDRAGVQNERHADG